MSKRWYADIEPAAWDYICGGASEPGLVKAAVSIAISLKRMADAAERANQILSEQLASERDLVQEASRNGTGSRTDGEGDDSLHPKKRTDAS